MSAPVRLGLVACAVATVISSASAAAAMRGETVSRERVESAMRRATTYFREEVASHGGYVYYYSPDLERRWGEGEATADQIWVQPPGTPTVGLAYLRAHEATGDRFYLEAARQAAHALVYGQLESGGWTNRIDFASHGKRTGKYRNGKGGRWNMTSLDDGQTQSALGFLIRVDEALSFRDRTIHEAVEYGLKALLAHQFPNGAFPQGWDEDPLPRHPTVAASYPDYDWRTEGKIKNYWDLYTLNDDNALYLTDTLIAAHEVYGEPRLEAALKKLGDFLILAQMPEPQPAWAQQYRYDMRPAWARKFEPPAIASSESMGVMEALIRIARHTGERKYLEPIPPALAYLRKSLLPEGKLARYYELKTNRPLYMKRGGRDRYVLTHDDADLPRHYGWKIDPWLDDIERDYDRARRRRGSPETAKPSAADLEPRVRRILEALDDRGRWISTAAGERLVGQPRFRPGQKYIASAVFAENLRVLVEYIDASR